MFVLVHVVYRLHGLFVWVFGGDCFQQEKRITAAITARVAFGQEVRVIAEFTVISNLPKYTYS